ncbi:MAG: 50S ribosomal protein L6 [Candidatus Vogelbacteria bacterium]|nr:50S ribosomal protein L6 [Candidatus Vogelbacteria bacterium]
MSRLGKQPITIPAGAKVTYTDGVFSATGPKGAVSMILNHPAVALSLSPEAVTVTPTNDNVEGRTLWGTYASHIKNILEGVTTGFEKKMIIEGVGFKFNVVGTTVVLDIGFSHQVKVAIPAEVKVVVEKNIMTVSGASKEAVGQFAARIRGYKPVEPYKGKGIRYEGEYVLRKQGKKSTA